MTNNIEIALTVFSEDKKKARVFYVNFFWG